MTGAGEALRGAVTTVLAEIEGLTNVFPGPPLQGSFPFATVEPALETDWGSKTAKGREVRLYVTIRDEGERPERVQALTAAAGEKLESVPAQLGAWRLVSLSFLRSRIVSEGRGKASAPGWASVTEYRARMLASED